MSETIDEKIKEIAVKHGVVLSKDDPILIVQTMNEKLINETRKAQAEILTQFKEEIESVSAQWKDDATEKAEKILNAALARSKDAMAKLLQESATESLQSMKKTISDALSEAHYLSQQARKFSKFTLVASMAILAGFLLTCLVLF